jgi:hypothetical protein
MVTGESDERVGLLDHGAVMRCPGDGDAVRRGLTPDLRAAPDWFSNRLPDSSGPKVA